MIGVGIVGLGKSGLDIHVPCIEATPEFKFVAGCDTTAARRECARERTEGIRTYSELDKFLENQEVLET